MTTLEKSMVGATLALALGGWVFEAHQNGKLREAMRALRQEQLSSVERIGKLEEEQGNTKQQLTALRHEPQAAAQPAVQPKAASPKAASLAVLPTAALEDSLDRAYAETTPGRREAALGALSKSIAPADIPRALAYLAQRPGINGVDSSLFGQLASKWGESDPNAAVAWANGLSDAGAKRAAIVSVLNGWAHVAPEAAATFAAQLPAGQLQDAAVIKVVKEWSFRDAQGAAAWVSGFPSGQLRDRAVDPIIFWGQGQCPAAIADMLDTIGNAELIKKHGEMLANVWLSRDAAAARLWIERSGLPEEAKQRLLRRADEEK